MMMVFFMKKYRVLFLTNTLDKGGAASGASNLLQSLQSQDCLEVFVYSSASNKSLIVLFFRFLEKVLNKLLLPEYCDFFKLYKPTFNINKLVKSHDIDIVQMCDVSKNLVSYDFSDISVPVFHRLSDFFPYVGNYHYCDPSKITKFATSDNRFSNLNLIFPSYWLQQCVTNVGHGFNSYTTIMNASSNRKHLGMKSNIIPKLGFISASLDEVRKGYKNLEPFFSKIDYQFIVYGKGSHGLFNNVCFAGVYSKSDIEHVFKSFNILLCPYMIDNSPNTLTEALSFGIPVIAQSGTGMDTYINENHGFLFDFKSSDYSKLNNLISIIIENYNFYSINAKKFSDMNLSHDVIGSSYLSFYNSVIDDN